MEPPLTSKTLLFRIRDTDDDDAWKLFAEIYGPLLFRYFRGRGLNESDASDVLQMVLVAVARAIRNFEYNPSTGTFRSWLYTVARSKLNTFFSKDAKKPIPIGQSEVARISESHGAEETEDESDWDREYRRRVFEWACDRVRDEFKEPTWKAFWGTAVEGRSASKVAEDVGMKPGAIYTARSRVTARLKREVDEHLAEEFEPPIRE